MSGPGKNGEHPRRAVFFDRDGVLIEEVNLLTDIKDARIPRDVPGALKALKEAGFQLFVASNQTVVSRGLITEQDLAAISWQIETQLMSLGAPAFTGWYACPHHPKATVAKYRVNCECRKPKPGMLLQAAREHNLDLSKSFMVGDRITDIIAGAHAGCRTVLLTTGAHELPPIETVEPLDESVKPTFTCGTLPAAADWIIKNA
jgi:D-glycero-D-manno-heptose 1,7-bisphosphate phosphatase